MILIDITLTKSNIRVVEINIGVAIIDTSLIKSNIRVAQTDSPRKNPGDGHHKPEIRFSHLILG